MMPLDAVGLACLLPDWVRCFFVPIGDLADPRADAVRPVYRRTGHPAPAKDRIGHPVPAKDLQRLSIRPRPRRPVDARG